MTEQSVITKTRIMEVARVLFADQGYDGTSVREIAKAADVNVASVNYHFITKENLFAEILRQGYMKCANTMREFYDRENPHLEDTLIFLFRYFIRTSHDLISQYKIVMSSQHTNHRTYEGTEDSSYGPPGGKVITLAIQKEVGEELADKDLYWGMRTLFTQVTHYALMYNCCYKAQTIPFTSIEDLEDNIRRLCQVVLKDLKTSRN